MRKINRKTADPVILQQYEEMRFERRYPKLEIAAWVIRACGYAGILPAFFIPQEWAWTYIKVWMVFAAIAIIMELTLLVAWQPRGRRLKALALIVGTLMVLILMAAGFFALMDKLLY
jgi:hypothetical protein